VVSVLAQLEVIAMGDRVHPIKPLVYLKQLSETVKMERDLKQSSM